MMDTLLFAVLSNAVLATFLAVVVVLVGRMVRRPALLHALWLLVLLKLVTPPLVPVPIPWPGPAVAPAPAMPTPTMQVNLDAVPVEAELVPVHHVPETVATLPDTGWSLTWQQGIAALWLMGALIWWGRVVVRVQHFRRTLRLAVPAPDGVQERARQLATRLGLRHCPPILLLSAAVTPMLWVILRTPRVLVPAALWQRLTAAQRDTLLTHELAHLRRGDAWVRRLELLVLGLYWWHPVAWWACRALAEAEEQCCDAWVVWTLPDQAEAYASALVETVAFLSGNRRALPAGASGIGHLHHLKRRLSMIVRGTPPHSLSRWGLLAVCLLGVILLPLVPLWGVPALESEPFFNEVADPQDETAFEYRVPVFQNNQHFLVPLSGQSDPTTGSTRTSDDPVNPHIKKQMEGLTERIALLQTHLHISKDEYEAAKLNLRAAEARLKWSEQKAERDGGGRSELDKARAEVEAARKQVALKQARYFETEAQLKTNAPLLDELRRLVQTSRGAAGLFAARNLTVPLYSTSLGRKYLQIVPLSNGTDQTFRITGVRVSNAALEASPNKMEFKPGEEGNLALSLDTARITGTKTIQVWVQFSEPRKEEVLLEYKVIVTAAPPPPPVEAEDRTRQLEQRLDRLLNEVEELRKELRPKKSEGPAPLQPLQLMQTAKRDFFIPFQLNHVGKDSTHVTLWHTADDGKTWERVERVARSVGWFTVRGLKNGPHGFTVTLTRESGEESPAPKPGDTPLMRVEVTVND